MQTSIPSQLLLRLLQATPEQIAAIERILGSPVASADSSRSLVDDSPANRSIAARILELLTALDPDAKLRKAPPIKVFLLRYRHNLGPTEIASRCKCDEKTIFTRLKQIRSKLSWQPQQLCEVSSHVEALHQTLSDSRARSIYRKGVAFGDGDDEQEYD